MSRKSILLKSYDLSGLELPNRFVMAPLTRQRAGKGNVPNKMMKTYYSQRASAGLIISEGSQISQQAYGYNDSPGIFTKDQVKGWKKITEAVHKNGGRIFLQLWHVGRHSHPVYQPDEQLPVAPSAVKEDGQIRYRGKKLETVTPRALLTEEIPGVANDYADAAVNAIKAGFDGVEIHGANGYLIDQFLQDATNKRTDRYGGSIENRSRFMKEVVEAVCNRIGKERVGIRLSPGGAHGDMSDSDPKKTFTYAVKSLNQYNLAYLHLVEPFMESAHLPQEMKHAAAYFRKHYNGTIITCGGYDFEKAEEVISAGHADLVAFGRLFISNPDLAERYKKNAPLNDWDCSTFYSNGKKGYIDYPTMKEEDERILGMRYCCKR
ncbi:MAG: alkene reductase [Bacteroidales bacterium]|nr:alkene reductase [Bacteroidales bacterium]MCF8344966.1 alkene reductase [Bacteroidales bacterium]MCF8352377.1 alkene reductase [Bacteroidales bacterium]MCF8377002.1 alkene reductase [Bacteroidales bacterium]MCF8400845.1 alkene reductase [Bacteroidales bacterium]